MLEESGSNKVVGDGLSMFVNVKTKQNDSDDVIDIIRQVAERMIVTVLAGVQRLLSSSAFLESCFHIFFIGPHFGVVGFGDDVCPSFLGEIYQVAVSVLNRPAFARVGHFNCLLLSDFGGYG